jgi:hypothetical protein
MDLAEIILIGQIQNKATWRRKKNCENRRISE